MRSIGTVQMAALVAGLCALAVGVIGPASAKTFRYAFQGDAQSLDPHGLNETFSLGYLGNVYEGLTAYSANLELVPALAESWRTTSPTTWVFKLRKGVKFHNGNDFTAAENAVDLPRLKIPPPIDKSLSA